MQGFHAIESVVVPLDRANVDTDAIIPKQFLKSIHRSGFGRYLFDEWRYLDKGEPGMDCSSRPKNSDFVLNRPEYANAQILLARHNFGCGSSREHAPWALADYGIKVIIAPSFADIFYNNCFKNGILPIVLSDALVDDLFQLSKRGILTLTVSLDAQYLTVNDGRQFGFEIDSGRKRSLLLGLDEIGETLQIKDRIKAFEREYRQRFPWLFQAVDARHWGREENGVIRHD
jgi:3-isopropylmalate/(R)-2-methylmalate dehydratase small subunit